MTKDMMVKALSEYFKKEGGPMGLPEYKEKGNDVPVKDYLLRRAFGSWSRVLSVVSKRYPVEVTAPEVTAPEVKEAPVKKKAPAKKKVEKKDVE
jgi:hypothetical protein